MKGIILKPDQEKRIECYLDAEFAVGWNQEYGKDPGSVLSRWVHVITYAKYPVIWAIRL